MTASSYEALGLPVHRWTDVAEFLARAPTQDAVHVVALARGRFVELLVQRLDRVRPADEAVPVFFSGAITNRAGTAPPYFSGVGLTRDLDLPLIAVSDPLMSVDPDVALGWYTGPLEADVQDSVAELLAGLSRRLGRELLLLGGSGGAFAALYYAARLGATSSACVWNPQSDLLRYQADAVRAYLMAVGAAEAREFDGSPAARESAKDRLVAGGVDHALPACMRHRRSVVLQNASDWHVTAHLAPVVQSDDFQFVGAGTYENSAGHCVLLADFGTGHAVPPWDILVVLVRAMVQVGVSGRQAIETLFDRGVIDRRAQAGMPRDLRADADGIASAAVLEVREGQGCRAVSVTGLPADRGPLVCRFTASTSQGRRLLALGSEVSVRVPPDAVAVDVVVYDGFGNILFHRRLEMTVPRERIASPPAQDAEHSAPSE